MDLGLNGQLVHSSRCAAGLTVAAFADRVGVRADIIWAIEQGDERKLEQLPVAILFLVANSLDLHPSELLAATHDRPLTTAQPDDVMLEAVLLEFGVRVDLEVLAVALDWPFVRIERALAALHQRLASTGARLHPVGADRFVIKPNRHALTADQRTQLGQGSSQRAPLTADAATALYNLFALQSNLLLTRAQRKSGLNTWRTDDWDDSDEGLSHLGEQHLLDHGGLHVRPSSDVYFSLGLGEIRD